MSPHVDADRLGAQRRVAAGAQRIAERRVRDPGDRRERGGDERQREPVVRLLAGEPRRRPHADDAVGAAGDVVPLERDRPDDLRERERQHREIDAGEPHAEPADDERAGDRDQRRQRERRLPSGRRASPRAPPRRRRGRSTRRARTTPCRRCPSGAAGSRRTARGRGRRSRARGGIRRRSRAAAPPARAATSAPTPHGDRAGPPACGTRRAASSAAPTAARPSARYGLATSTIAITTNSATSVSFGKAIAMPPTSTVPSAMHSALVSPIRSAATNAPGIEPSPPTTVTTNASAMIARSMPRFAGSRGSCSAPASPARKAPSANTVVNSAPLVDAEGAREHAVLGRGADEHAEARALEQPPQREQHERPDGEQEEVVGRDHAAEDVDRRRRAPARAGRAGPPAPQIGEHGVADDQDDAEGRGELQQLGRRVDALQQQRFDQRADERDDRARRRRPRPRTRAGRDRARRRACTRRYAPSMYSEPCAKLTTRVTPKISVSPAATRNSADEPARPFSSCAKKEASDTLGGRTRDGLPDRQRRASAAKRYVIDSRGPPHSAGRSRLTVSSEGR